MLKIEKTKKETIVILQNDYCNGSFVLNDYSICLLCNQYKSRKLGIKDFSNYDIRNIFNRKCNKKYYSIKNKEYAKNRKKIFN